MIDFKNVINKIKSGHSNYIELKDDKDIEYLENAFKRYNLKKKDCSSAFTEHRLYVKFNGVKLICRYLLGMGEVYQVHLYNLKHENDFIMTEDVLKSFGTPQEEIKKMNLDKQFPMKWEEDLSIII